MDDGGGSLLILSVSIVGILGTALLLLSYYLFLTRCGLLFFFCRSSSSTTIVSAQDGGDQPPLRRSSGLEEAAIRRIPTFRYGRGRNKEPMSNSEECAVCLADFRDGERLQLLPACLHAFHIDCVDAWLQTNANCPLCRAPVVVSGDDYHHAAVVVVVAADIADPSSGAEAAAAAQQPAAATSGFLVGRRSLSMDSCADKHLALQRILQQQIGEEDAAKVGERSSRRLRRSFFSFSHSHSHSRGCSIMPL